MEVKKMDLGRSSFRPFVIKKCDPPEIPEKLDELAKILVQRFEIKERQTPLVSGTSTETAIKLQCPFCKSEFTGLELSGCFHYEILPLNCPICGFRGKILQKFIEESEKQRKDEQ